MTEQGKAGARKIRATLIILLSIITASIIALSIVLPNKRSTETDPTTNGDSHAASPSGPQGSNNSGSNLTTTSTSPQEEITTREQTDGPTSDNNTGETEPPLPPTSAPFSSSESEPTRCPDQLAAYEACFAKIGLSNDEQISCMDCADKALGSSSFDSCDSFVGSFCPSLTSCTDCGSCASLMDDYYICAVVGPDCEGDCSTTTGATEYLSPLTMFAAALSEDASRCPDEMAAFDACVADNKLTSDQQVSCYACADNALQQSSKTSCDTFVADFCPAINACSACGTCTSLLDNYYICSTVGTAVGGTCTKDCSTTKSNTTRPKRAMAPKQVRKPGRLRN